MISDAQPITCERIKARGRSCTLCGTSRPEQRRVATQVTAAQRVSAAGSRLRRYGLLDDALSIACVAAPCIQLPGARNASRAITRTGS